MDDGSKGSGILYMAFELGQRQWKLGFTIGGGQRARRRTISARDMDAVLHEIARARQRFGLAVDAPVLSCYEAGRDGFWLHRYLQREGITNYVVDSASIEVNRRQRRAKSDGLDVEGLLRLLLRYAGGEHKAWSVVRVPSEELEDLRQLHRELATLKRERTRARNRLRGLLATQGVGIRRWATVRAELRQLRRWDGSELGPMLRARLEREVDRLDGLAAQIVLLETARRRHLHTPAPAGTALATVQRLAQVRGLGEHSAWVLALEAFAWREFRNRREVGGALGLAPTPYQSGTTAHEQGISKAGNVWVRGLAIELAWLWLRWQPESEISQWYHRRFGTGSGRQRRLGIVAVARKLMIALWRYSATGVVPTGAQLKDGSEEYIVRAA
jgi:transposase